MPTSRQEKAETRMPATSSPAPSTPAGRERFRLLVDHLKDYAIFMLDLEGRVASWNDGAQHVVGYRAAEVIGQSCSCFYPKEEQQTGQAGKALQTAMTEGRIEEEGSTSRISCIKLRKWRPWAGWRGAWRTTSTTC
jgi:PAS domain-containing protein